jgi:indole-3-glycerol phosphate synthase
MTYLDKIIAHKKKEVAHRASLYPEKLLKQSVFYPTDTVSLSEYLLRGDKTGIIAEFKRASPGSGSLNTEATVEDTTLAYMQTGSSALSILTDESFFNGSLKDLQAARELNYCPILQKDFIVFPYQIIEAKSYGADAILLIAAVHSKNSLLQLYQQAIDMGLEVLIEIHNQQDIEKLPAGARMVGVNARDLTSFQISQPQQLQLIQQLPSDVIPIAESGINSAEALFTLKNAGYQGFLIGTRFMQEPHPGEACKQFSTLLKTEKKEVHNEVAH